MTVVVGTAGHIDHGKTALLRSLTGIDADRLPEERRRGMTIDVGYAWLALPDGTELDFVDVPGHDRLVGNMLVGAGEIDAALLVLAADDGPRAQTLEHLALLDAMGMAHGVVAVTKVDLVDGDRMVDVIAAAERLIAPTSLAGAPVVAVSSVTGEGIERLSGALVELRDRVVAGRAARARPAGTRLAIDRVFPVRGRGTVVTGTLRGSSLTRGSVMRLVPADGDVRVRGIQVHGREVDDAGPGRAAFNLAGADVADLRRGQVVATAGAVIPTARLLVALSRPTGSAVRWPPPDRTSCRLHLGTDQAEARVGRAGRDAVVLDDGRVIASLLLGRSVAAASGDRFVLRRASPGALVAGGMVLDPDPTRGVSRRRQTVERLMLLARSVDQGRDLEIHRALLELHGVLGDSLAADVAAVVDRAALEAVSADSVGLPLAALRSQLFRVVRNVVTAARPDVSRAVERRIEAMVARGNLVRHGDRVRLEGAVPTTRDPRLLAAQDRLEGILAVPSPPSLLDAGRDSGCSGEAIRELEREGRIVVVGDDLAYATRTWRELTSRALTMAAARPLTPSEFRDATGTSRKYALAILEDLDRRGILRRIPEGHVPGPRAPR